MVQQRFALLWGPGAYDVYNAKMQKKMNKDSLGTLSGVERREGNYEFGEYKANIYESKDTYERSKIRYRHEDEKWRVRQL